MPTSGDIVLIDFGLPEGHEAGFPRPAVVVTASDVLDSGSPIVQVVPLTSTVRRYKAEVVIEPDAANQLSVVSSAQCQHIRSFSRSRVSERIGMVSTVHLRQIRETLALLLDL